MKKVPGFEKFTRKLKMKKQKKGKEKANIKLE